MCGVQAPAPGSGGRADLYERDLPEIPPEWLILAIWHFRHFGGAFYSYAVRLRWAWERDARDAAFDQQPGWHYRALAGALWWELAVQIGRAAG